MVDVEKLGVAAEAQATALNAEWQAARDALAATQAETEALRQSTGDITARIAELEAERDELAGTVAAARDDLAAMSDMLDALRSQLSE